MKTIKPKCECDSREFRSNDHILATSDIVSFDLDEDGVIPEYCGEAEVNWDTQEAVDPAFPYECSNCLKAYSAEMLVAAHTLEDEEPEEE